MANERLSYLKKKTTKLPDAPGVYLMYNKSKEIIYVGKAKLLKNRVSSYFRSVEKHTPKVFQMVEHVWDFNIIVTSSEFEALVLEASLIKQHHPKYNILLKDAKGYSYIRISKEPFPRITAEKQINNKDNATYLGPYTSSYVVTQTVEAVNKAFMFPDCSLKFPQDFRKRRPCLNFHIKRCMGVCTGKISELEYQKMIIQATDFIHNGSGPVLHALKEEMSVAAEQLQFEKAAALRDKINAIERITDQQNVVFVKSPEQDVIALAQAEEKGCFSILKLRKQRLVDKQDYIIDMLDSPSAARREFILSYYNHSSDIPPIISIDGVCNDHTLLEQYLSEQAGRLVEIRLPQRGEKLRLVEMARQNAAQALSIKHSQQSGGREVAVLNDLARLLGLSKPPEYIESYDISNMGEDVVVGGMVVFKHGKPYKKSYRKFNIKTIEGIDDYGSMREVIRRRFLRYKDEKETEEGFGQLPDLILLDGGKGHVNAVAPVLEEMGLQIPLFGMVKDQKHRTRAIATNGGEIAIQANRNTFTLLSQIQDEVHRFTIGHMRSKRKQNLFTSELSQITGMGPARIKAVLRHFKTQTALKEASCEELATVKGMTKPVANALYTYLHPQEHMPTEK